MPAATRRAIGEGDARPSPAPQRAERKEARRGQLVEAAASVFMQRGVAATSVDDIVRAAGVAKGTFYLYFATKDAVVTAVAEAMVLEVADRIQRIATKPDQSPVEQLLAFGAAIGQVGGNAYERDLIEIFHRPENRAIHDRISEHTFRALAPLVSEIVAEGVASGMFRAIDPGRAAAYVFACFASLHDVLSDPREIAAVTSELNAFVLRGLGYDGELPHV
jgi:AcrR family transcriptional regulator